MTTDAVKLVTFRLGQDLFAADVGSVERVLRYQAPNAVPDMPGWVAGVIEHRGTVIPVVDLRRRIEVPDEGITLNTRILLLASADGVVGAIVDAVLEVVTVAAASVAPPPKLFRGIGATFLRGIAKVNEQLLVVLDVDQILASADRIVLERALHSAEIAARG